ncbi:MAG: type II toxin-antitoxin system RelE/ParE family toxin [Bacteroidia bacterium]|nr:type II toxin-antitoxin system RelE/ParE family toxin [Bacteroidia bacterium]
MLPLLVKDDALADIQKAYDYLEEKQNGLGERLLQRLEEYLSIIEMNPMLFKEEYKKVRQLRVQPFQYVLRFKVYKNYIGIIQLFNTHQSPNKKKLR